MVHHLLTTNENVNIRSTRLPMLFRIFLPSKDFVKDYIYYEVNHTYQDHILSDTTVAPLSEVLQHAFIVKLKPCG
jgi:hypothetical protein